MSAHNPPDSAADRGELLAAYLDGDVDEMTAQRLERRLRDDEDLRAELDRIHDVVVALRRVDAVEVPPGLSDRIRAHVHAGTSDAADATDVADAPGATAAAGRLDTATERPVTTRTGHRPSATPRWWQRPITVAAALGLLGVVAVSSLGVAGLGGADEAGGDGEMAAMSADSAGSAEESRDSAAAEGGEGSTSGGDTAAGADAPAQDGGGDAAEAVEESIPEGLAPLATDDVAIVEGLEDPEARQGYLRELRTQPEMAERLADPPSAASDDRYAQLLADRGVPDACIEAIAPAGLDHVVRLLETSLDGAGAVGAVTAEGDTLVLRIADLESCGVVAETADPA